MQLTASSTYNYPDFNQINLVDYELVHGFSILGFLKKYRDDCIFITAEQWQDYNNYEWLDQVIQKGLKLNKIICIIPWDEFIINPTHLELSKVLNKYTNDPVWFITQLDDESQKIYTFQHNIKCKIIELPWWMLNDCLGYYAVSKKIPTRIGKYNYLCMLGRYESHKFDLAKLLREYKLDNYGLITVSDPKMYPEENLDFCIPNKNPPYRNLHKSWPKTAAQAKINDVWVSSNVENFLFIEQEYTDIPLIINPETTCGIFFNTEKSLWPLLLGKLMLVYGRPGAMKYMQRFYDVDFSSYANLDFDLSTDDWTKEGHFKRLQMLVYKNRHLIEDCNEIYQQMKRNLESARWTLGRNIYKYFVSQLDKIQ